MRLPDGDEHDVESLMLQEQPSRLLGQAVTLASESSVSHFDDGPVSLLSRAFVAAVSGQRGQHVHESRFRSNIVLEGVAAFAEEEWIGRRLTIGSALLHVEQASPRCVMVDAATAEHPAQPGNLLTVGRLNGARLGVVARVVQPGVVRVGDSAWVG